MCHFLLVSIVSNEKSAIIQVQDLLNFLNLQGSVFSHIWKVFSCYFFGYFFNLALSPLFPGLNTNVRSYDKLPKVSEPSIFFFSQLICLLSRLGNFYFHALQSTNSFSSFQSAVETIYNHLQLLYFSVLDLHSVNPYFLYFLLRLTFFHLFHIC